MVWVIHYHESTVSVGISNRSVQDRDPRAIDNLASNEVGNVEFARLSAEEMGRALRVSDNFVASNSFLSH